MERTEVWILCLATGLAVGVAGGLLVADPVPDCVGLRPRPVGVRPGTHAGAAWPDPAVVHRRDAMAAGTTVGAGAGCLVATVLHLLIRRRDRRFYEAVERGRSPPAPP